MKNVKFLVFLSRGGGTWFAGCLGAWRRSGGGVLGLEEDSGWSFSPR